MQNGLDRLRDGVFATPLTPGKRLDQVTVLDIAGLVVHAIENPDTMVGRRIDLASDSVTGEQVAAILGEVLGREIPYQQIPPDQVRQRAGEQIATMFARFEQNTYFLDTAALRAEYPQVGWHDFRGWAQTIDWDRVLAS